MKILHSLIILILLSLTFASCDKCKKTDCVNGECDKGICTCDTGYEGDDCSKAYRDKFLGTHTVQELCNNAGVRNYTLILTASDSTGDGVLFDNLYNLGASVYGTVGMTSINIESQLFLGDTISGNAQLNETGDSLTLFFNITGQTPPEECVTVLTY